MAQQIINIGIAPNDGTGDPLRDSQQKANANFTELYSLVSTGGVASYKEDFTADASKQFTIPSGITAKAVLVNRVPRYANEILQVGQIVTIASCEVGDTVTILN